MKCAGPLRSPRATLCALLVSAAGHIACAKPAEVPVAREPAPEPAPSAPQTVSDDGDESVVDFYRPLASWGDWIEDPRYGTVWAPSDQIVGGDFVPYTSGGSWIGTDAGWVFQSRWDTAWGWATFHYGRWYESDAQGWVWVPDVVWGPSWVDWRYGDAYVGWAPAAPAGLVATPEGYSFVETRKLTEQGVGAHLVPADGVGAAYGKTQPARELRTHGQVRWSLGPPASHLAAAGLVVQPVHCPVPGPGDLRKQARVAATKAVVAGTRKKPQPRSGDSPKPPAQVPARPSRQRSGR